MRRRRELAPGRGTLALGAAATAALGGVLLAELRRVWRRGSAPALSETDHPLLAAEDDLDSRPSHHDLEDDHDHEDEQDDRRQEPVARG